MHVYINKKIILDYTIVGLILGTLIFGTLRPLYETITRPVLRSSTNP